MKFLLSCTNHLTRFLHTDLPRLPTPPGAQAGVRRLSSTPAELAFQCHYYQPRYQGWGPRYLLAIEAESRYCLILPLRLAISQAELAEQLQALYLTHVGYQLFETQMLQHSDMTALEQLFVAMQPAVSWVRNTDLSLQGTITQIEFFLQDALEHAGKAGLSDQQVFVLSLQFNETTASRTVQGKKQRFVPALRFVADAMLRFGPLFVQQQLPDNVVDLAAYKALRR